MSELPACISENLVNSFYKPSFIEKEKDNIDLVIVTNNGDLMEISKKNIVLTLNLEILIEGKSKISVIHGYSPAAKYYLVGISKRLFIVKKAIRLEIYKQFSNVKDFIVQDCLNIGKPQLEIYFESNKSPVLLDPKNFVVQRNDEVAPLLISAATLKIKGQLHAMEVRLKKAEEQLIEKKVLVSKMTLPLMYRGQDINEVVESDNLVCLLGKKSQSVFNQRIEPFCIRNLFVRTLKGQWIIGFLISNLQEKSLINFELFVRNVESFIKETILFIPSGAPQTPVNFDMEFELSQTLGYGVQGYLLGILDELYFVEPSVTFHCTLCFNFDNSEKKEQFYVGEMCLFYSEITAQIYFPFNSSTDVQDLLSILALSVVSNLTIKLQSENSEELLCNTLINLGFRKIKSQYFVGNPTSNIIFHCCFIKVIMNKNVCYLQIYTQNSQQLLLLMHSLKNSAFRGCHISLTKKNVFMSSCSILRDELKCIKDILKRRMAIKTCDGEVALDLADLSLLSDHQFLTDKAFTELINS